MDKVTEVELQLFDPEKRKILEKCEISQLQKCGIDQNDISRKNSPHSLPWQQDGLNLIILSVSSNNKITDVSFMKNLKILYAGGTSGIDRNSIRKLKLDKIITSGNINFSKES